MITQRAIHLWYFVHKWSSLVCTAFLLLLCLTGLPLIFHHEIDELTGAAQLPPMPAGARPVSVDRIVETARAQRRGEAIQFVFWDADEPAKVGVSMAATPMATENIHALTFDGGTGKIVQAEKADEGVMYVILKLHTDLFAGLPGKLFLGLMGLLFVAAIVSGVVLYGPFMRKLDFGTVRRAKSARVKWLDRHNLLGIVTVAWVLVVGTTGVVNTWADLVIKLWQFDQLGEMVAPYKDKPALRAEEFGSLQAALEAGQRAAPGMTPAFVGFPGTEFSSQHHFAVFMRGTTPLTARLLKPALVDARSSQLTDSRALPWYMSVLLVSQPLHFGDYGGLPLKIIWALLDVATIVVLGSGLYLWLARRQRPLDQRVADVMAGGEPDLTYGEPRP
jgi:uncharacterized iron-regulated membrane protein